MSDTPAMIYNELELCIALEMPAVLSENAEFLGESCLYDFYAEILRICAIPANRCKLQIRTTNLTTNKQLLMT